MLSIASRAARGSTARVAFAATRALNTKVPVEEVKAKYLKTEESEPTRRAFTYFMVGASGFAYTSALKSSVTSFLSTMSASADVLAMSSVEVDLNSINKGTTVVVKWRGKPLFIRHRTAGDIEKADATDHLSLVDPQHDDERVTKKDWLIVLGVCTHLGCVPIDGEGDYGGWFCPCHGSHYDTSGRIRKGPAPLNLEVPPYRFTEEDTVVVG